MKETWVPSLDQEMATHSSILAYKNPKNRGAWQATVYQVTKSWTQLSTWACMHPWSNFQFWSLVMPCHPPIQHSPRKWSVFSIPNIIPSFYVCNIYFSDIYVERYIDYRYSWYIKMVVSEGIRPGDFYITIYFGKYLCIWLCRVLDAVHRLLCSWGT